MIAESPGFTGAFTEIAAAERAYRHLCDEGFDDAHMSLWVNEDCPACLEEHARSKEARADRLITAGQITGGIVGFGFGAAVVRWPPPTASSFDWLEGLVSVCVVASWLLTGAILGAMAGAVLSELRPGRRQVPHRHYVLSLRPPKGREDEALAILRRSKAAIDGEGPS